jgi:hypothetical protein
VRADPVAQFFKNKGKIKIQQKSNKSPQQIFPLASRAQLQITKLLHHQHDRELSRCSRLSVIR